MRIKLKPAVRRRLVAIQRRLVGWAGLVLALGLGALIGIDLLYQPGRFPFRHIDLKVQRQPDAIAIDERALGEVLSKITADNYFSVDLSRLAALTEQVPGVHRASLRRIWPDTLRVRVQPVRPQAVWNRSQCLHADGRPHACPEAAHAGLAQLYGPAERLPGVWRRYVEWRDLLENHGLTLHALQLDEQGLWRLLVSGVDVGAPMQILLPDRHADTLLMRFTRAAGSHLAAEVGRMRRVDLRYANGFAVQWRPQSLLSVKP